MTIWMSEPQKSKKLHGLSSLGGLLGVVGLMVVLILAGVMLIMQMQWPRWTSVLLCFAVTVLAVILAMRLGRRGLRAALVFFLDEEQRLYIADLRQIAAYGRGLLGYAAREQSIGRMLENIKKHGKMPSNATEIIAVEKIRENRNDYAVACILRGDGDRLFRFTYVVPKGYPEENLLLQQLELRQGPAYSVELEESRTPLYILLSALACAASAALCFLSHPAFAILPQKIYFPFLAVFLVCVTALVTFIIRRRRGE